MKPIPPSTLPIGDAERPMGPGDWISAVLETIYQVQRYQALQVIRAYRRLLEAKDESEPR